MKDKKVLDFYAKEYNEQDWNEYASSFPEVENTDSRLKEIPYEIIKPLNRILGYDDIYRWVNVDLRGLGHYKAIELLKTEKGTHALKAFIMRMPL